MMKLTFRVEREVCLLAMSQSAEATDKSRVRLSSARLNSLKLDFRCGLMGATDGGKRRDWCCPLLLDVSRRVMEGGA